MNNFEMLQTFDIDEMVEWLAVNGGCTGCWAMETGQGDCEFSQVDKCTATINELMEQKRKWLLGDRDTIPENWLEATKTKYFVNKIRKEVFDR
jgi:hypothetical protein